MSETEQRKRTAPSGAELDAYLDQKAPGLTAAQREEFKRSARTFGLDPWKREIYAVTRKERRDDGDDLARALTIVIGYEVFLKMADEFPQYDGYELEWRGSFAQVTERKACKSKFGPGSYTKEVTRLVPRAEDGDVECVCHVFRTDRRHAVTTSVCWSEFAQDNSMWNGKPRIMLEKVAIARGHRLAFPNEFGGVPYISEELPDYMVREDAGNAAAGAAKAEKPTTAPQQPPAAASPATSPDPEPPKQAAKSPESRKAKFMESMAEFERDDPETYAAALAALKVNDIATLAPADLPRVFRSVRQRMEEAAAERAKAELEAVDIFDDGKEEAINPGADDGLPF